MSHVRAEVMVHNGMRETCQVLTRVYKQVVALISGNRASPFFVLSHGEKNEKNTRAYLFVPQSARMCNSTNTSHSHGH